MVLADSFRYSGALWDRNETWRVMWALSICALIIFVQNWEEQNVGR